MEHIDVQKMIDEAVAPLRMAIEALSAELEEVVKKAEALEAQMTEWERRVDSLDENTASEEHYHDEYASQDHVERSENSFNSRFYRIEETMSNLEYRISDVERKAERAQSTADNASRSSRGYY